METGTCTVQECRYHNESSTAICSRPACPLMTEPSPFVYLEKNKSQLSPSPESSV